MKEIGNGCIFIQENGLVFLKIFFSLIKCLRKQMKKTETDFLVNKICDLPQKRRKFVNFRLLIFWKKAVYSCLAV